MGWKDKIVDALATTSDTFGGATVNSILDYFSAVDLTNAGSLPNENADIATPTVYASSSFQLWDSNKSHKITVQTPDYTEAHTITLPSESALGTSDEWMFKDAVQIVTGKTMDFTTSNTAQNIPSSALPSSILYNTIDNALGAHYLDISNISTPANPSSTTSRIFRNTSTGKTSVLKSDGSVLSLEEGNLSQAGGFAAGGTSTQSGNGSTTAFTIAHGLPDTPDVVVVNATSADAISSVYQYDVDATNITITYNTAPPSGSSNLIWYWGAAYVNPDVLNFTASSTNTFSNKTIPVDTNIIKDSTTNTQGDIYTYQTDRAKRLARSSANKVVKVNSGGTDTEFGDVVDGSIGAHTSTKITITAKGQLNSAIMYEDEDNNLGAHYIDQATISTPSNQASGLRVYAKTVDANNDGWFIKQKLNSSIVEARIV